MAFVAKLWKEGYDWDEELGEEHQKVWKQLKKKTIEAWHTTLPRFVGFQKSKTVQLHIFTDASETAACSMAYLAQDGRSVMIGARWVKIVEKIYLRSQTYLFNKSCS